MESRSAAGPNAAMSESVVIPSGIRNGRPPSTSSSGRDPPGMPVGHHDGDEPAHRVPDHQRLRHAEEVQHIGHVVGVLHHAVRTGQRVGPSATAQVRGDHPVTG